LGAGPLEYPLRLRPALSTVHSRCTSPVRRYTVTTDHACRVFEYTVKYLHDPAPFTDVTDLIGLSLVPSLSYQLTRTRHSVRRWTEQVKRCGPWSLGAKAL